MILLNESNRSQDFNHNVKNVTGSSAIYVESGIENLIIRDSLSIVIPLTIVYTCIFIAGVIGNVINCLIIIKIQYMRTTTNFYLFSLSISDLLLLTSGLPQEIYSNWQRYPYTFGEQFCVIRGLTAEMSTNATVLTIIAFTVERYYAICHPFHAHSHKNPSKTIKLIAMIWLIAFISAVPQALQFGVVPVNDPQMLQCLPITTIIPHSFELSTLLFFVIPMIVITILYVMIGIKLKNSAKVKQRLVCRSLFNYSSSTANTSNSSMNNHGPSQKVLISLVTVVVTFFVCWTPFHIQRIMSIHGMKAALYDWVTYISAFFYYMSSMINPILYQITCCKFREAFKKLIGKT